MGKQKYKKLVYEILNKSPVVSYDTIKKIIKNKKYVKRFVNELIKSGKVRRITKGYYSIYDDPSLYVFCVQPAYFGLQDALSFHNLWEQESIPIVLTIKKIRQGIRKIFGLNVMIRRIDKKYLFGIEYHEKNNLAYPYSDIEKTLIDMIYYKQYMDEELQKNFKEKINKKKLKNYLKLYPKKFRENVLKRIGFKQNIEEAR